MIAKDIRDLIAKVNDLYAAQHGQDLFKATNKTAQAQASIGEVIANHEQYKSFVENLYFLFWEAEGQKITEKPQSFKDVNTLRTELQHDTDHGDAKSVLRKKTKHGALFLKLSGAASSALAAPVRFTQLQVNILKALRADLRGLLP